MCRTARRVLDPGGRQWCEGHPDCRFQANAAAELTPRILAAFKNNHPEIHVQMRSFDFADPTAGLADGGADVAFVRPPLPAAEWLAMETLFIEPRVLVVASSSRFACLSEVSMEQVADEPFVARKAPDKWRDFWLATQARGGQPVRLGTQVATVDECFEAIMSERGIAFTQASTQRFYDRPGLSFIPVRDVPPSPLSIAWRTDVNDGLAHEFVETAPDPCRVRRRPEPRRPPPGRPAIHFASAQLAPPTYGVACRRP
ncbi:LysR family substrate-binding domain-containing protein [Arthrobacter sp. SA17]